MKTTIERNRIVRFGWQFAIAVSFSLLLMLIVPSDAAITIEDIRDHILLILALYATVVLVVSVARGWVRFEESK